MADHQQQGPAPSLEEALPGFRPADKIRVMVLQDEDGPFLGVALDPSEGYGATPLVKRLTIEEAIAVLNSLGGCIQGASVLRSWNN